MRLKRGSDFGFTLVEVMVAIVLIGIGISALSSGLGTLTKSFGRSVEREEVERLAQQKYDELVATRAYVDSPEGEFDEARYQGMTWQADSEATSVDNVNYLRVTVDLGRGGRTAVAEGLVYEQPVDSSELGAAQ